MRSSLKALALVLTTFAPVQAHAFCRTVTVTASAAAGEDSCPPGVPLYHPSTCVPYHLLAQPSVVLPKAVLSEALGRAFAAWTAPNTACTPGISGVELEPVDDAKVAHYVPGERGRNVFGVVQGPWPHDRGTDTLALTTLSFDNRTGEIFDVDLEIREDLPWSSAETAPANTYDLHAAMTHEIGHVLGLSHSLDADASMYASYVPGSISQRKLSADDTAGICAMYPDRETRSTGSGAVATTACNLAPSDGAACGDPVVTHGCAVAPHDARQRQGGWGVGASMLGVLVWRSRRRGLRSLRA